MGGFMILGVLAAFGLFCALWAVFGWLLPGLRGCALVFVGVPGEMMLKKYRLLRDMGLLECPLLAVAERETERTDIEICCREALLSRLEMERNRFDGTGDGDHSGNHQRGGVPEL